MLPAMFQALLGLVLGSGSVSTQPVIGDDAVAVIAAESETKVVPTVRVEIKLPRTVLKSNYQALQWGETQAVELSRGEKNHTVEVTVRKRDEAGNKLTVTVAYEQDGEPVIAPLTFDTRIKKREIVSTDGVALALTVKRKTVVVEPEHKGRTDKLDEHDSDDPLAGLD